MHKPNQFGLVSWTQTERWVSQEWTIWTGHEISTELNSCIRFGRAHDIKAEDAFYVVLQGHDFLRNSFSSQPIPIKFMHVFKDTKETKEGEKQIMNFPNEIVRYLRSFPLQP